MKIVLRNIATGLFLTRGGQWSANPKEARGFLDAVRARDHRVYRRLSDTAVVALPDNLVIMSERIMCEALAVATWQLELKESEMNMKETTLKANSNRKVGALTTPLKSAKVCTGAKPRIPTNNCKVQDSPRTTESI